MFDFFSFLPLEIIVFFAILLMLLEVFINEKKEILAYVALGGVFLSALSSITLWNKNGIITKSFFSQSISINNYSLFFYLVFLLCAGVCIFISPAYLKRENSEHGEYYSLILFAVSGMMLMASADDLITQFLGLEIMSISVYVLAGFKRYDIKSNEAVLKYFFLGAFSAGFILYGIALIYGACGTTVLHQIKEIIASSSFGYRGLAVIGSFMLMTGVLFKVAAVPFHSWTPDVYEGAPSPVTGFMISAVKVASFAMFLKIFLVGFIDLKPLWVNIFQILAVITMFVGNIFAFTQENIKRMLAYSSISHTGYLLMGIASISTASESANAILYYLVSYAVSSVGLFACISFISQKNEEYVNIEDYAGIGFKYPAIGIGMSIFMLSLIGVPPTAGFFAKYYLFTSALSQGMFLTVLLALVNSMMSIYYYLKVIINMYMKEPKIEVEGDKGRLSSNLVMIYTAVSTLWLGIGSFTLFSVIPGAKPLIEWAKVSIQSLF